MKRGKKLISLLGVLVLLVGATFAATNLNPDNSATEPADTSTIVFSMDADAVNQVSWDYSEAVSFARSGNTWVYTEDDAFPLDTSYIDTILETLTEVTAYKTIENAEDLDQYGLEVPVCTVTVTAGDTYTLCIGNETSMSGQRYFSSGDGNVYLVDADIIDCFSYGLYDVLAYESIPAMTNITGMELTAETQSYKIQHLAGSGLAYSDDYVWFMDQKTLDTELTETLLSSITSLSWIDCVSYNAEDLSAYGLDAPAASVTIHYTQTLQVETNETDEEGHPVYETQENDASFTLEIGSDVDENCYAKIAGSSMVYEIDGAIRDTLLYTTYSELQPDEVVLLDWDTVNMIDITLDGTTYQITKEVQSITDEEGNTTEETVYLLSGKEIDVSNIMDVLDTMTSTGYATGLMPERSEEIRLVFHRDHDTFPEVELVFFQYDSSSCVTTLNGEVTLLVSREDVVELVEAVNARILY